MKKKDKGCATPNCWMDARSAGFCGACYSGLRRLQTLSVLELAHYGKRIIRLENRFNLRTRVTLKRRKAS